MGDQCNRADGGSVSLIVAEDHLSPSARHEVYITNNCRAKCWINRCFLGRVIGSKNKWVGYSPQSQIKSTDWVVRGPLRIESQLLTTELLTDCLCDLKPNERSGALDIDFISTFTFLLHILYFSTKREHSYRSKIPFECSVEISVMRYPDLKKWVLEIVCRPMSVCTSPA